MKLFGKRKVVLALGGGGARGLSNVGVLRVLERHFGRGNLPFDMIVGTSIGSLIGASYCHGMTIEELEERALKFSWPSLVDLGLYPTGLIKGDKLEEMVKECVGGKSFEGMNIPFALTTTDIETGEELTYTSGDLVKLIRASCSWPGVLTAVEVDGRLLGDGGVRNSIPTKAARELGATLVIAVNPGFGIKRWKIDNVLKAFLQGIQIMGEELNTYQARTADLVMMPKIKDIDQFDFSKAEEIIKQGELAAEASIGCLKRKLFFHRLKCPRGGKKP